MALNLSQLNTYRQGRPGPPGMMAGRPTGTPYRPGPPTGPGRPQPVWDSSGPRPAPMAGNVGFPTYNPNQWSRPGVSYGPQPTAGPGRPMPSPPPGSYAGYLSSQRAGRGGGAPDGNWPGLGGPTRPGPPPTHTPPPQGESLRTQAEPDFQNLLRTGLADPALKQRYGDALRQAGLPVTEAQVEAYLAGNLKIDDATFQKAYNALSQARPAPQGPPGQQAGRPPWPPPSDRPSPDGGPDRPWSPPGPITVPWDTFQHGGAGGNWSPPGGQYSPRPMPGWSRPGPQTIPGWSRPGPQTIPGWDSPGPRPPPSLGPGVEQAPDLRGFGERRGDGAGDPRWLERMNANRRPRALRWSPTDTRSPI